MLPTSCSVEPKSPRYPITPPPVICLIHFVSFSTTKLNKLEMTEILNQQIHHFLTASKSCNLDLIPTPLTKQYLDVLVPVIAKIINTSLTTGIVTDCFKSAVVKPLLKKPGLDVNALKNVRPVSYLPFLSKILENVVLAQLESHLSRNTLREVCQSAYRQNHSTETLLVSVTVSLQG